MKRKSFLLKSMVAMAVGSALNAMATPLLYTGSAGSRAASVSFEIVGGALRLVLTNSSAADMLVPTDVLTGVFFNVAGNPLMTRTSVTSAGMTRLGTTVVSAAGSNVGGEWAYLNSLAQYGANSGVSSTGLGVFGPGNRFPGPNLAGPASPAGLQYGLATFGDNPASGNGGLAGNELTQNAVTILLGGLAPGFQLSSISHVTFQYGTALTEPSLTAYAVTDPPIVVNEVPEPGPVAVWAAGMLGLGWLGRRRNAVPKPRGAATAGFLLRWMGRARRQPARAARHR
jgi:uncharacterized protein (TIGR03382 family)